MGDKGTTVPLAESTRDRLGNHRHADHDSWDDTLNGTLTIVPDLETLHEDGCARCGETPWANAPIEELSGFIHFFNVTLETRDGDVDAQEAQYYCSQECMKKAIDQQQKYSARDPDRIVVGGKAELRSSFEDATFHLDPQQMEVGLDIPGAFGGTSSHGNEYDYIGEPVFVQNHGEWVHSGVIEDIIHEETHTGLVIDPAGDADLWHPGEERREDARERWADWRDAVCPECGWEFRWCARRGKGYDQPDAKTTCGECEADIAPEEYDDGDGEPGVPPWETDE